MALQQIRFIELLAVDSTNNYAMGLIREGMADDRVAVFAHSQTAGKGQRGRQWLSVPRQNMALSILLKPELPIGSSFLLSMAVANGLLNFLQDYTAGDLAIKWPNDIYWCDRKAAGILIENTVQGAHWNWAVIGIGVNVTQTQFPELGRKAVSLKQITGRNLDPASLARSLHRVIIGACERAISDPGKVVADYNAALYRRGRKQLFKKDSRVFEALIKEVTPQGRLIVEHVIEESFAVGDIEWVIGPLSPGGGT